MQARRANSNLGSADRPQVVLTDEVARRHQHDVWRHLRFLGAPPSAADDLTQDAFLAFLRWPPSERGDDASVGAWLRSTARHLFRTSGRAARRGIRLEDEAAVEDAWVRLQDGDGAERRAALDACVAALPARQRRMLELRYADGVTREAMSVELSLSIEGVKSLLRRVKAGLRECIERRLET